MNQETSQQGTPATTLVGVLRSRAERHGEDLAYTFLLDGERTEAHLTYAELDRRARGLAATLAREGIGSGARVLLLYPPGLDYIAAFFGCLYAGAVAVPAYPPRSRRPSARLQSIQESAGARAVLATASVLAGLDRQLARRPGVLWQAAEGAEMERGAEEWREPEISGDSLAFLQYTSGSTAAPKGVMLRHANLLANLEQIRISFAQTPADRTVIWLPPYHDMGLIGGILTPLYTGNTAVLLSPVSFLQRPLRWLQAISRYRGTTSGGPNFAYDLCVEKIAGKDREELDLSSWTLAFNGAEPVRAATLERFAAAFAPCGFRPEAFLPCYGLAEGTLLAATVGRGEGATAGAFSGSELERHRAVAAEPGAEDARTLVGSGTAPEGARLLVVDPEPGVPCAPGTVGEIWIAGPAVAAGYWGLPEVTAATFGARTADGDGPWLRTGDLGFLSGDGGGGELFVTGRSKDLIILRGRNHYPQDIELTVERAHPSLRPGCGAAFAVEPAEGGGEERLVVVQEVRREHREDDPAELVAAIRRAVAEEHEMQVQAVVLLRPATLPKTTSGKIQRSACRARYLDGTLEALGGWQAPVGTEAAPALPEDLESPEGVRRWLAAEVAARAGMTAEEIDLDRPLDHYPLDSLAATELMHAIESRLGVVLSMESFFAGGSLAELAESIQTRAGGAAAVLPSLPGKEVGDHPLSRGQQSLWFLHALDPLSAAYNVASAVRIRGELDVAALRESIGALIARHPVLRSTFPTSRGEPVQRVHATGAAALESVDAQGWSDHRLAEYLAAEGHRPFDLERGPLMRVVLVTRTALEHVLLLAMHHIVTDFWSLGLLLDDLALLYPALRAGERRELPAPGLLYTDYVDWQEAMLAGPEGERLWEHWRSRLGGELPVLDLHTDRPRPRVQTHVGAALQLHLSPHLSGRLKELGREHGATPFVTLLAAFEVLLHRYTGQGDFLVGSVTAARTRAGFARTLGYFVNPLVLRATFGSTAGESGADGNDPGFADLLGRTRADALGAFEHQDFPFPLLVERLQSERDTGRSALFQVMFVLQKAQLADGQELTACALGEPGAHADVGGLRLEVVPLEQRIAQFDLTLTMGEVGEAFVASFDYNVQLFDAATAARWGRHFERLLEGIVAAPAAPVSELPLITPEEERQLTAVWNDTGVEYRHEATLPGLLAEQAARTPHAIAVISGGESVTYGDLDRRANRLARHLRARGIGPGSRVAVCLERSPSLMVGLIGVLKAGAAYLPIDPETPRARVAALLDSAGVGLVVTEERLWPVAAGEPEILALDAEAVAIDREESSPLPLTALAASLACVIYTSGSTGAPKGVLLTHRNLVNLVASFLDSYRPEPADRILPLTALGFASFVGEIFPLLCAGGTLVLPDRAELLDVSALTALIERHGISIVSTVPSMMANLNARHDRLPRLRLLLVGGEALSAGDVDKILGTVRIVNGYGLTETSVCSTCHTLVAADLAPGSIPPIGRPLMNHRVYLLDRHLQPLPVGCPGEIFVAGDGLARGYLGDSGATAERFLPDPWDTGARMYRTGDLGLIRSDGALVYLGRVDQQVKLRGYRIELAEVESVLALHPRVKESFVIVRADDGEPQLVAYLVPEEAVGAPTAGELFAYLRERLPDYMVPGALVTLAALPLTPNGKVDRGLLPAPDRARPTLASAYSAPRSELERTITAAWQAELSVETVGVDDNFFDLGGHSLRMAKVHARLKEALGREVSLIELFQYPTVSSLARHLSGGAEEATPSSSAAAVSRRSRRGGNPDIAADIAIVGMAGRFPGAKGVDELWRNVAGGREGITFFTTEELLAAGVDPAMVDNPNYVRAKGILGDVDLFDASFFGLNPREVELMDPQHRLFLECSWEALEHAGWDADRFPGLVGVYAGLSMNTYMIMNLLSHMELVASVDTLQASLGNDKDPMTSRVSYKLNLKGPSVTIQSASSTSLVAVHQACQALHQHDCDMALAGGVSIHLPEASGYLYQEGGTTARDGHCRAFDASATGFVSGHGAGVVVLKRLDDALAEGDTVYAVIKGSACNNDGSLKVSFMAPSIDGQVEVYRQAYENAGVDPRTLSYIECHGTGTALGDPIEIAALSRVFADGAGGKEKDGRRNYCAIGSLKTNIGHLDTAAGVCGLIKTALSLHHGAIPPSLHFEAPNPRIDFASSPFFVNTELRPWPAGPRRAGVTSLGMGGTNAHVVLEEAPKPLAASDSRPDQLLLLSAKSAAALERSTVRLADHLRANPDLDLPDVAFTLTHGRKPFQHRRALLANGLADATVALETLDPERILTTAPEPGDRPVAFLFPGQGAQYAGMGRGLYGSEPSFRDDVDLCCRLLQPHLGFDLREALFEEGDAASGRLQSTQLAQPALFVVSWAAARLWMSWGVRPEAMLGHSIGEYVAACLAGVFSLEDALAVVAVRGRLMAQMPPGAMLGVPLPEAEILPLLGEELSLAAVNRPSVSVVSGPVEAIEELAARLTGEGLACRRLHTSHAFHSRMMDPVLSLFLEQVKRVRLEPPRLPFLSNVTGTWIRPEEATDPAYWVRQLRQAVRFADGVALLLAEPHRILLELGPGNTLSTLARQHPAAAPGHAMVATLRHPKQADPDAAFLLHALARFWLAGGEVDWTAFWAGERRRRTALPTYPFERRRYWVDPLPKTAAARPPAARRKDPAEWLYVPVWKQSRLPVSVPAATESVESWLVFLDGQGLGEILAARLEAAGRSVTRVSEGAAFSRGPAGFTVAPGERADYDTLLDALGRTPTHVLHLWNVTTGAADVETALDRGFYSLVFLAQALGRQSVTDPTAITVVSTGLCDVTGEEPLDPVKATLLGPLTVMPREYPSLSCRGIDVSLGGPGTLERTASQVWAEIERAETGRDPELPVVAFRGALRWVRSYEPSPLPAPAAGAAPRLREGGVVLITGGMGGIGIELAEHLAGESRARLVLVGRSAFPERKRWSEWLAHHDEGDATRRKIERLLAIEERGGEVLALSADVADPAAMREVVATAERRFGAVHAVIHAAGVPGGGLLQGKVRETSERILAPKVRGALALADLFAGAELDFFVLTSSITVLLPEVGQTDYVAANAFLDSFAALRARTGEAAVAINWDAWREVGMAVSTAVPEEFKARRQESLAQGLTSREGVVAFQRIAGSGLPQVVVSTLDLASRRAENKRLVPLAAVLEEAAPAAAAHPRPALATTYVPPQTDLERSIAGVWAEILGVEPVGVHDNFFELGGNSLAGLRLVQRLRERLGAGLSEVSLYEAPTVGALARMIAAQGAGEETAVVGAAPAEQESRQRGERRKARLQGRRGAAG